MNGVPPSSSGLVVNLLAFLTGAVLYVMLVLLVWRERSQEGTPLLSRRGRLPLLTGLAGFTWNLGGLVVYSLASYTGQPAPAWLNAVIFTALGTLPAFIVHSLFDGQERVAGLWTSATVTWLAYGIAAVAGLLHFEAAFSGRAVPPPAAVWLLTIGFTSLTVLVLLMTRGRSVGRRSVWVAALSTFAVSALHFDQHGGGQIWWVELLGHHASLPLALAILHQDYRFAFADLFLKNAIAWLTMMALSATMFSVALVPLVRWQQPDGAMDARAMALAVALWAGTAMLFPLVRRLAGRLVDQTVLKRPDYSETMARLTQAVDDATSEPEVVAAMTHALDAALGATDVRPIADPLPATDLRLLITGPATRAYVTDSVAVMRLDTVESPRLAFNIGPLRDGRRLLSDDLHLLEVVTRLVARRVDALRVADERLDRSVREQQMQRLATEAELRALRAQINPHFLFNALTTIGYLIQTTPPRALTTLLTLTGVLRAVLRQSHVDFVTLEEELTLVQSYLEIETARFEERLTVRYEVAANLGHLPVPSFILQPLVENAVKHGISPLRQGGSIIVRAQQIDQRLVLEVTDTGAGFESSATDLLRGVGLASVERRLQAHYGSEATFVIESEAGRGTRVRIAMPSQKDSHVER
jgi:two-component system LytT family sensor kinase